MPISPSVIDDLKASGSYFAAGALARDLGRDRNYGCHFGMRSSLDHARAVAKAIAYKLCGKDADAQEWARELVRLLHCAEILA